MLDAGCWMLDHHIPSHPQITQIDEYRIAKPSHHRYCPQITQIDTDRY